MLRLQLSKTLHSAFLAATLYGGALVILTLYLNPQVSFWIEAHALALALFLPYTAIGTLVLFACALLGMLFRFWPLEARSPLQDLPWFTSLVMISVAATAFLYWNNIFQYRYCLPIAHTRALTAVAIGLTIAALILLGICLDVMLFPKRARGFASALVVLAAANNIILPLALRPTQQAPARPMVVQLEPARAVRRVTIVGLDGMSSQAVGQGVRAGKLPALAAILKDGAFGPLHTFQPAEGPPLWMSVVTGTYPREHGVKGFVTYRLLGSSTTYDLLPKRIFVGWLQRVGLAQAASVTAGARRRHTLWQILNALHVSTGIVRMWTTFPVERVNGFMLSHYFHVLGARGARETLYPLALQAETLAKTVRPEDVDRELLAEFVDCAPQASDDAPDWRGDLVRGALSVDLTYQRAGELLRSTYEPSFYLVHFFGMDRVGHPFLRYAQPERFGDVSPEDARRYGHVMERYAAQLDRYVGELLAKRKSDEIVMVVSAYGMEPVSFWRRFLTGWAETIPMTATHVRAPAGFIAVVGDGIRAGTQLREASVLSITPTVLYLMGQPVARDMEGQVLTELLTEDYARNHPVTFIPSYESLAVARTVESTEIALPPMPDQEP
ncbi:MAG: alkaline phosphatase family protein [Vicinamibacteria bacterium]|jgi:predicted AlkP superfamily phosphohydrolase/phosphomutase|nr:alkaline phosphatase family protein [Vicinamibacteria bacterium]